jgi:hypothetical protein
MLVHGNNNRHGLTGSAVSRTYATADGASRWGREVLETA